MIAEGGGAESQEQCADQEKSGLHPENVFEILRIEP